MSSVQLSRAVKFGLLGAVAALAATLGDLLLLWVVNAARADMPGLPPAPAGALLLGHYLGAITIPFYAAGYWAISRGLAPAGERGARAVFGLGAYAGAVGAAVHGMTAIVIHMEQKAGALGGDPMAVMMRAAPFITPLWILLGLSALVGTVLYAILILGGRSLFPRWMAFANPLTLTALVALLAAPFPLTRDYLGPAAPNLTHIFFFGIATLLLKRQAFSSP